MWYILCAVCVIFHFLNLNCKIYIIQDMFFFYTIFIFENFNKNIREFFFDASKKYSEFLNSDSLMYQLDSFSNNKK